MKKSLTSGWQVLQDVHDSGEALRLFDDGIVLTDVGHQLSEWEPIDRLQHLQILFADRPYWGRELRYFNHAPWWYLNEFVADETGDRAVLEFSNVDYFCRVWLNGEFLGEHEGYSLPFSFDVTDILRAGEANRLVVKVWSPWDTQVDRDAHSMRTFRVVRDLVKGTYEHDDTLIARDVNPVGIYGTVKLHTSSGVAISGSPALSYSLDESRSSARLTVRGSVVAAEDSSATLEVTVRDSQTGAVAATERHDVAVRAGEEEVAVELRIDEVNLWNVWDRGNPHTYDVELRIGESAVSKSIGFRTAEMLRDEHRTTLVLNGKQVYIRGTSYFPDVYLSTMTRERYLRDLAAIKSAGFNLVRVHVHVELDDFYDLCDKLGLAVMQDSEYNWTHPVDTEWAERMVRIYAGTVETLRHHPSIVTWILLNEPGVLDVPDALDFEAASGYSRDGGLAVSQSPGPQLVEAVTAVDPSRPIILGSFCEDDPLSGDSHNYRGSLEGPGEDYTAIDGTTEKLNTEFGFDAPGSEANLRTIGKVYERLRPLMPKLAEVQHYQYRLTKYYTEHYRRQRGGPNWGYVQFMFIDLAPQSFYGVYDWWGTPKPALAALMESNQPVIVLIEQTKDAASAVWVINDSAEDFGTVRVRWRVVDGDAQIADREEEIELGADAKVRVSDLAISAGDTIRVDADLIVQNPEGRVVTHNRYRDLFGHPTHVPGHPTRMNHEFGVRLYSA